VDLDVVVVVDGDVAGQFVAHGHVQVAVAVHVFVHAHVSGFAHARLRPTLAKKLDSNVRNPPYTDV
jgi:hypothetical protein